MSQPAQIPDLDPTPSAFEDWLSVSAFYQTKTAMRPTAAWFNGLSTRLHAGRMKTLRESKAAVQLAVFLDQVTDRRLKTLRTFAAVNLEQASAAFKQTMIANVSAPILLLTFINQITDGGLGRMAMEFGQAGEANIGALIGGFVGAVIAITLVTIYALAALGQARDLRHLLDIHAAERGIYFGLEDMDDMQMS